jgi:hypothetical protein
VEQCALREAGAGIDEGDRERGRRILTPRNHGEDGCRQGHSHQWADTKAARKVPDQAVADITPALSLAFTFQLTVCHQVADAPDLAPTETGFVGRSLP